MCILILYTELLKAQSQYEAKQSAGNCSEKTMLSLLWDLEELNRLNKEARAVITAISVALDVLAPARTACNLPKQLNSIRVRVCAVVQGGFRFKRTPATH